jgi:hypothetical protein
MLEIGSSEKSSCGKGSPLPESHEMTKSGRKQCGFLCKALWRLVEKFFRCWSNFYCTVHIGQGLMGRGFRATEALSFFGSATALTFWPGVCYFMHIISRLSGRMIAACLTTDWWHVGKTLWKVRVSSRKHLYRSSMNTL